MTATIKVLRPYKCLNYIFLTQCQFVGSSSSSVAQKAVLLKSYYKLLNVREACSNQELKDSYYKLIKNLHPDRDSQSQNTVGKFFEIQNAYTEIIKYRQTVEKPEETEDETLDFTHKTPQNRHYLEYSGDRFGPLSQRYKQHQQKKVEDALENLVNYQIKKDTLHSENSLIEIDKKKSKKNLVRNAIDRLVEDLISESMSRGDFDNLPGSGKPLEKRYICENPHIDTTTYNLNRILINNGYVPKWVTLEKEIRNSYEDAKLELLLKRQKMLKTNESSNSNAWKKSVDNFNKSIRSINKSIDRFNIMARSMVQQLFHYNAERELKAIADTASVDEDISLLRNKNTTNNAAEMYDKRYVINGSELNIKMTSISFKEVWKEWKALFKKSS